MFSITANVQHRRVIVYLNKAQSPIGQWRMAEIHKP